MPLNVISFPSKIENNAVSAILNISTINTVVYIFNISIQVALRLDEMRVSRIMLLSKNRQSLCFSSAVIMQQIQVCKIPEYHNYD